MKETLLEIIRCPSCQGSLELAVDHHEGEEIERGKLVCRRCEAIYPIKNSLPHMIHKKELEENSGNKDRVKTRYEYEWKAFPDLFDCGQESEEEFFDVTSLSPEELRNKRVCDLGCGWGRHTTIAARYAREVVALDLSESGLKRAREVCAKFKNVHYVLGDVTRTPFADHVFDFSYCLAVLTFLSEPEFGFKEMARLIKSEGGLSIYVLRRKSAWYESLDKVTRRITAKLPNRVLHGLCFALAPWIPLMKKVKGTQARRRPEGVGHVFDWFSSPVHHSHTAEEVAEWFKNAGFDQLRYSTEVIGVTGWKIPQRVSALKGAAQ